MKTNISLSKNKFTLFGIMILLFFGIGLPQKEGSASTQYLEYIQESVNKLEIPKEMSDQEYQKAIEEFYDRYADFIVVVDLEDPKGIDPKLLPADIASLVDGNTKIVAYKETVRPDTKPTRFNNICEDSFILGIPCKDSHDGTRDLAVSKNFGGVEQFSRVQALRYDEYTGCGRLCVGWEFEQQWSKWNRTDISCLEMSKHEKPLAT